jgi:SAM-dependent methyltransferase
VQSSKAPIKKLSRAPQAFDKTHWDVVAAETLRAKPLQIWRAYMRRVYLHLVQSWLPGDSSGFRLKTDLFEEAVSAHHLLGDLGPHSIGIDTSSVVVGSAHYRLLQEGLSRSLVVGDLRQLPFRPRSINQILSGSSLDHFSCKSDITRSLEELAQVLTDGGVLVITFDNPHNPIIWVRNHLPFVWLNRSGLVPYYVGVTFTSKEARHELQAAGLTLTHEAVVCHAPRVLAIAVVSLAEHFNWQWLETFVARLLYRCEALERWPTRYFSGYYLAFRAEKRAAAVR